MKTCTLISKQRLSLASLSCGLAIVLTPLAGVAANAADASSIPRYAPVKQLVCTDCKITVPADMIPTRGLVLSQGSFAAPVGYWTAVDLDKQTLTRFITQINPQTHQLGVVQSRSVPLSGNDLAIVVTQANLIWSLPDKLPLERTVDVVWGLDLFDGGAVRKEYGPGKIQGAGADLNNMLDAIWRRLAR